MDGSVEDAPELTPGPTTDGPDVDLDYGDASATRRVLAAAEAATNASRDAETTARSASETSAAAARATTSVAGVAHAARQQTADTVAAAAAATATLATEAAEAVEIAAAERARVVAAAAIAALNAIAAQLSDDVEPDLVRFAAASVATSVATDAVAQAKSTADAAELVAAAVRLAAAATARAATGAASQVARAAGTAAAQADVFAGYSAVTEAASERTVDSTAHVSELAIRAVAALDQPALVAELQQALARDEFLMHYQPIYNVSTGDLVAVEALLRWQHPTRGLLGPVEFIDTAEQHPLASPIGEWVMKAAIHQASVWRQLLGPTSPRVWVNVSCEQIGHQDLPRHVARLLADRNLPADKLGVEVTERQLARRVDAVATDLLALHHLGISLAVDDFGTGYASLDYLRRFEFDEIKIDRSFISGLGRDPTDTAVTTSIIALGRSLGLTVVAEGVETEDQYDALRRLGCDAAQGYLMAKPGPVDLVTDLMTALARNHAHLGPR